jgi:signal transduction histidine kinase
MKVVGGFGVERAVTIEVPRGRAAGSKPRAATERPRGEVAGRARRRAGERRRLLNLMRVLEHEMRTPLATSLLQLSAAEAAIGDTAAIESARASLAGAARQLRTLSMIVRRAVQIESEEPIDLYPQRVDLGELVQDFVMRLRATGRTLWSTIDVRVGKVLVGDWDPAAIEQILENLLSNALKFGEGRPVVLTVAPERGGARITVRDAGVGIEAKDRERIFGRFVRGSSARGVAGLGIGLWVVRHLIRAHGGRVLVRSRPGKWTALDVWLPQLALYPASTSLASDGGRTSVAARAACSAPALDRRGSKGPMRKSPCSAAKRTKSPTL